MKIGIIGAMPEETKLLKESLNDLESWTRAGISFYKGSYGRHEVVLVQSGIGKVQAAMTTALLIHEFKVTAVLNTGSAGGIGEGLHVGDVVLADKSAYFDVDVTGFGYRYGQLPQQPLYFDANKYLLTVIDKLESEDGFSFKKGTIVTGDSFIDSPSKILRIKEHFPDAVACEMEGAAIAQVCHQFGIACLVFRAISDTADHQATKSFDDFIVEAGEKSAKMILRFLDVLN